MLLPDRKTDLGGESGILCWTCDVLNQVGDQDRSRILTSRVRGGSWSDNLPVRVSSAEVIFKVSRPEGVTQGKDDDRRGHPFDIRWRRRREHKEDREAVARNTEDRL